MLWVAAAACISSEAVNLDCWVMTSQSFKLFSSTATSPFNTVHCSQQLQHLKIISSSMLCISIGFELNFQMLSHVEARSATCGSASVPCHQCWRCPSTHMHGCQSICLSALRAMPCDLQQAIAQHWQVLLPCDLLAEGYYGSNNTAFT